MPPSMLSTHLLHDGDEVRIRLRGELGFHTVADFSACVAAALQHSPAVLVVDMGGVTLCESTGFAALVQASWAATAAGCKLTVVDPTRRVLRSMTILGLHQILDVVADG